MDTSNYTFSQAVEAGLSHSDWLDGQTIDRSLRDRALASHSALLENAMEPMMPGMYGPLFDGSLRSCDRPQSLASRLQVRLDGNGSPEYRLISGYWGIDSTLRIYRLRASARHTSGSDYSGWPTATKRGSRTLANGITRRRGVLVSVVAGWVSPTKTDAKRGVLPPRPTDTGVPLSQQVGAIAGLVAMTERRGACLNPAFVSWLMGYSHAHLQSLLTAMQSFRK